MVTCVLDNDILTFATRKASADDKIVKNLKMLGIHDYNIWNHNHKCIQISTNLHGIGVLIF